AWRGTTRAERDAETHCRRIHGRGPGGGRGSGGRGGPRGGGGAPAGWGGPLGGGGPPPAGESARPLPGWGGPGERRRPGGERGHGVDATSQGMYRGKAPVRSGLGNRPAKASRGSPS